MAETYPIGWKTLKEKEEFARHEQFLLFPLCFQKTSTTGLHVWERVKKECIKRRKCPEKQYFLPFPYCPLPFKDRHHNFTYIKFVVCRCFKLRQMQNFVV